MAATIFFPKLVVGCNDQKLVMFVLIIPYSNMGNTFIDIIFVLDFRISYFQL